VSQGTPENPAPNPAQKTTPAPSRQKPRRWWRRIWRTALILVALALIFHRPLLIALIHTVAIKGAARQNIQLTLRVEGTILTNISLKDIRALPTGRGDTPVDDISIQEVTVQYSLPDLLRKGVSEFLKSYTLRNAYISVKPISGTREQKSDLASTLHGLIQQPALFSDRVDIENLNLVAKVPDGDFAIKGLFLTLDPVHPGALDVGLLQVPKVRTWQNLHAASTYADRDMILSGLEIDPQIILQKLELDASQRALGVNRLDLEGTVFGGTAQFSLLVRELPGKHKNNVSNATAQIDSAITDLSLLKISQYFGASTSAIGTVSEAAIHITGDPNTPSSWTGAITTDVGAVRAGSAILDKATVRLDVNKGWATFGGTTFSGTNSVTLQAAGKLPDSLEGFAGSTLTGWLNITGNDLHHFSNQISSGKIAGNGTFDLRNNTLKASLDLQASAISAPQLELTNAAIKAEITKALPQNSGTDSAPFDGLQSTITAHLTDLRAAAYALDSADVQISSNDADIRIEKLSAQRAANTLSANGSATLPRDLSKLDTAPGNLTFAIHAPSLAAFNAEPNLKGPDGTVETDGTLTNGPDGANGAITADVSSLHMQDFSADGLKLAVSIKNSVATIDTLTFALNPTDGFSATGRVNLRGDHAYDATASAHIRDLAKFNALLPIQAGLAGALDLDWRGSGDLASLRSTGALQFSLANGRFQDIRSINAAITGTYSPDRLDFPTFRIASSKGDLSAVIAARNDLLSVSNIAISQAKRPLLTGSFAIPLDLRTPAQPDTIIPEDGPISADLSSTSIAIDSFFAKGQAPASGTAKVSITARGSIEQPNARILVTGRNLVAKAAPTVAPTSLDADFTLLGTQLSLKARVTQPAFSPVDVAGTLPLPLEKILHDRKIDQNSPVQLSIRVPRSSLAIVTRLVPAVRYMQGDLSASIDVAGTIATPVLSGNALLDIPAIRLADPDMPTVNGFKGDLRFAGNRLTFQRFDGNLSGGHFDLTGGILFAPLTNPAIDLHFISKGDLLLRNESVTVRTDSDIRITGPLASASLTGDIGITKSRFFKEIEILPLELPGRPAPKPPPAPAMNPSIGTPPLRDWKLALKIHTKNPFIIQGNLANGAAIVDLNVGGTGLAPTLDGSVRIENFVASLPFSKLRITNGFVYFTKDDPFVPQLNIEAQSNLQDYNINVYIYGTAQDPKTVMSSEPPLPQEDIVALLATGATTSDLSNGNALAGRAAILVLQQVYHKFFKSKPAPTDTTNETFVSRFKVDVGGVDPRTGQQEVSSRFKLSDQLYLIGDLDVGGDIRGMVRYLLRFK
jgi:hypothetical protein